MNTLSVDGPWHAPRLPLPPLYPMEFKLLTTDAGSHARAGELHTDHGVIPTPVFMPVGTLGAVKAVHPRELRNDLDAPIMLDATCHGLEQPWLLQGL